MSIFSFASNGFGSDRWLVCVCLCVCLFVRLVVFECLEGKEREADSAGPMAAAWPSFPNIYMCVRVCMYLSTSPSFRASNADFAVRLS